MEDREVAILITDQAQEPRLLAYVANSKLLISGFQENKDPYATIASVAFNVPYEQCLEFHPETKEYQPDGKRRRSEAKVILLGIMYGRAIPSIADQLYGHRDDMTKEEKIKSAQRVYDSVMTAFPDIRQAMLDAQAQARTKGYTETILGRRRHIPDMKLPPFEFVPMDGYVNPDVDPLDPNTLDQTDKIPKRIVAGLQKEFAGYKYFGQKVKRIRQLAEEDHIRVINNEGKIGDGSRQCLNCVDIYTQILTTDGWKNYSDVRCGDMVYQMNLYTGEMVCDEVKGVVLHRTSGKELVRISGPGIGVVCTRNHKWPVESYDGHIDVLTTDTLIRIASVYPYSEHKLFVTPETGHDGPDWNWTKVPLSDIYFEAVDSRDPKWSNVWCVETKHHTWVAKKGNNIFLTHNSIIQGSAADQTKMAILLLENNEEWQKLGGRLLTPVHDELICEVPMENYKRGGELLSSLMVQAADFLPFTSKCDVTTSYRWYGLEYPCQHPKPQAFREVNDAKSLSSEELKWLQYMLYEMEYPLPTHKDILGDDFRGDKALGIDGIYSDELIEFVKDYMDKYRVSIAQFVDAIWMQVDQGTIPNTY